MGMACTDRGGVIPPALLGQAGIALSAALHLAAAMILLDKAVPAPPEEFPASMVVEIASEAPRPQESPHAAPRAEPEAQPPAPTPKPAAARVRTKPATPPPAAPGGPAVSAAPFPQGETAPAMEAAAPPISAPPPKTAEASSISYGVYAGRLHDLIARHRVYPPQSLRRREEGDVRLRILMGQDGRLLDIVNLAVASVHLTQAARQAVEQAAPFDPPPTSGEGTHQIAFDVTVMFRLR
ncbi:Ferric siderophore transport system periplasmic binding protein TonB [Paramagnetospirillum magnetotacticum MS-1]|uniref:Ferric siderophore transport system periplasmic binding protein TonB n=1 Tax=Paramagnetospirillum magnetotacticum MS-1 TaxID=272627 RepID=A0A0C2YIE3_PARME|nr:Ferric siderophore transport system periplasmic binding protein TonB [Paramagnetospirillum magnetotacticum MS-1]